MVPFGQVMSKEKIFERNNMRKGAKKKKNVEKEQFLKNSLGLTNHSQVKCIPHRSTKSTQKLDLCIVSALFVCILIKIGQNKAENVYIQIIYVINFISINIVYMFAMA